MKQPPAEEPVFFPSEIFEGFCADPADGQNYSLSGSCGDGDDGACRWSHKKPGGTSV